MEKNSEREKKERKNRREEKERGREGEGKGRRGEGKEIKMSQGKTEKERNRINDS